MRTYYQRRKLVIHKLLGGKCKKCGEKDPRVLQIDHVNSDGNIERRFGETRGQLYKKVVDNPKRYQLLCANCNWRKRDIDFKKQAKLRNKKGRLTGTVVSVIIGVTLAFLVVSFMKDL